MPRERELRHTSGADDRSALPTTCELPSGEGNALGWMASDEYLALARRSMQRKVLAPFAARGIALEPLAS